MTQTSAASDTEDDVSLQVVSDVHAEFLDGILPMMSRDAEILIMAGDIMPHVNKSYKDTLSALCYGYKHVVYVPGNHEYYGGSGTPTQVFDYIKRVCRSVNTPISLLGYGEPSYDIPETSVRVVGATLWTNIPQEMARSTYMLSDFNTIASYDTSLKLTHYDMNFMHERDKIHIRDSVKQAATDGKAAVVVTHHAPDARIAATNDSRATNGYGIFYYNVDMASVITQPNVSAWVFGHTHESMMCNLYGVRYPFITNALGYPHESTGFCSEGVVMSIRKKQS